MNKSELIEAVAAKTDLAKVAVGRVLEALIEEITGAVASGDQVAIIGFGTFKASERAAREGKNPKTGEKIQIPAATVPKFSAGAGFKQAVAGAK
ncbi:MAG: DNA-binding protein [Gammaproteobacteria bacterium RIFOXYA12_FULL_61_12]|nr:MAG: DNA-binding protein [Gammaproteobacteria bacterium RIFOXYD12_FULL_61_37]OGT94580.1 MAG: DNA-binding protein [Gammaproteobacteria bacterium RIFOXYA12_FULL_61_12]